MSKPRKGFVASSLVVAVGVAVAAIAVAQTDSGDSPSTPESGQRGVGVPEGPYVDFCPTAAQIEEHLRVYGFDYKPTVACTSEGEVENPPAQAAADPPDPDENLTPAEAAAREKQRLLNAKPLPHEGDPCTIDARYPDGERVEIIPFVCPEKEVSAAEFARDVYGP
jgi:hypothetical protein